MIIDILVVCCQSSWCGQTYIDVAKHTLNRPFRVDRFVKIHSIVIIRYDCWYFKNHSVQSWLAMVPPLVGCLALCCGSPRATPRWNEILVRNLCISDMSPCLLMWIYQVLGASWCILSNSVFLQGPRACDEQESGNDLCFLDFIEIIFQQHMEEL